MPNGSIDRYALDQLYQSDFDKLVEKDKEKDKEGEVI